MIKEIYFTTDYTEQDEANKIYTYKTFQYNILTKELKFVEEVDGKKYEIPLGTASEVEEEDDGD